MVVYDKFQKEDNMKKTTQFEKLAPLFQQPYFNSKEAKNLGIGTSLLHHYVKSGQLKWVQRGVYQYTEAAPIGFRWQDLILAITSIPHGVICLNSALAIYELAEVMPREHWIGIPHNRSSKKKALIKLIHFRNIELGKTEIELERTRVPIFDRERTIVDAFRLLSRETAIKALRTALHQKGTKKLDLIKLERYAKQLRCNIAPYILSETT